jgi:8-oxo-dGTP pyrophosphatase MutT (NUDIX family)
VSDSDGLYQDVLQVVTAWIAPDDDARERQQRFLDFLAQGPGCVRADNPGAHVTASALVVSADFENVLLCLHRRFNRWVQLGGHCEPVDETVAATAAREAWEESGIDNLFLHPVPIDVDIHPVNCRNGASHHYDVRFAILAPPDAVPTVSPESHQLAWFPTTNLPTPLATATDRLVPPALRSLR